MRQLRKVMQWYFLPTNGIASFTTRFGILWFAPIMFAGNCIMDSQLGRREDYSLTTSLITALSFGLLAGLAGYPIVRGAMKYEAERSGRTKPNQA